MHASASSAHDARDEAVGQIVKTALLREIGGHLIELREMAVLFLYACGLLGHLLLEIVVGVLETRGHFVETLGDLANFILASHFGAAVRSPEESRPMAPPSFSSGRITQRSKSAMIAKRLPIASTMRSPCR